MSIDQNRIYIDDNIHKSYASINHRSSAYSDRTYIGIEPNRSVKPSFTKQDYTNFRSSEAVPSKQKAIIKMCMDAYDNVGIIRNIIDLMGDFACQGMTIVHKNKVEEKFYRRWFEEINGQERSERFLNYLYRMGNVVVRRGMAKITPKQTKKMTAIAANSKPFSDPEFKDRQIPWSYEFLNPLVVEYKSEGAAKPKLFMNLSEMNYNHLLANSSVPEPMRKVMRDNKGKLPLDESKVRLFHYKKDDWLLWANPMVRPILDDIIMLEKMKLADLAALDGAISNVRLWTLGDLEHKIMPKKPAVDKLRDILASNTGGGPMDLIWGPDLKFQESATQVYKFLGDAKYQPVLTSIYAGLGVPSSLTGSSSSSGFTNNYVALKTLVERLEYGRQILLSFWAYEFKLVQLAMGFKTSPNIHFDNIVLSDEAAVNTLLINLADRDIISNETLLERLGELPEIEQIRIQRETKSRKDAEAPNKASPFHNPQHTEDMAKLAITNQVLNVKEYFDRLGLPSQKPPVVPTAAPGGSGGRTQRAKPKKPSGGRPTSTKDSQPRKQKRVLPRSTGSETLSIWAVNAQKQISEIISPIALSSFAKKNVRSLTKPEVDQLEHLKLCALSGLEPFQEITIESVKSVIESVIVPPQDFMESVNYYKSDFITQCQKEPSLDDLRQIYAIAYCEIHQNKS
jgi:hypothetical protein